MKIYRTEHPNPQWERKNWKNLNGEWEFEYDFGKSAKDRKRFESDEKLAQKINVPFCPESKLSGIGNTDFIAGVCYRKKFNISAQELKQKCVLHFGAVDFKSYVYINKQYVGKHVGGYVGFEFDITKYLNEGENVVFVIVEDDLRNGIQPRGKQCLEYNSVGCAYTRVTGIWQTVWLEFVSKKYIESAKYYPDTHNGILNIEGRTSCPGDVKIRAEFMGKPMGSTTVSTDGNYFFAHLKLDELHLWEIGKGGLYDLYFEFGEDSIKSYFGMRNVRLDGMKFMLNDKPVFLRMVLDQGYYPDSLYTAADEKDLINDIEISFAAGFNGARLHQKIFEPRFLYHCDRLGYMVWDEGVCYRTDWKKKYAADNFTSEWMELMKRDYNHPSVIGWCPFNETWDYEELTLEDRTIENSYKMTKLYDSTRPCIDASGHFHVITDIYDLHDYEQDLDEFKAHMDTLEKTGTVYEGRHENKQFYEGQPVFISEYGGIHWSDGEETWGYGKAPESEEEFKERYKGLTEAIMNAPGIMGFCYTQLYDIEQETNGIYTYERKPKFDVEFFRKVNTREAKIEK